LPRSACRMYPRLTVNLQGQGSIFMLRCIRVLMWLGVINKLVQARLRPNCVRSHCLDHSREPVLAVGGDALLNQMHLRAKVVGACFLAHYLHRALVYPLVCTHSRPTPVAVSLCAYLVTTWNGLLQVGSVDSPAMLNGMASVCTVLKTRLASCPVDAITSGARLF
jgi:hypothetical protein